MGDHGHEGMTRNQTLVHGVLSAAGSPLSAYAILDRLREDGFRAPLQVYRALDKLVAAGVVHRLESLNAFVACRHPECASHERIAFAICERCGGVEELSDDALADEIARLARSAHFALKKTAIELRGICAGCASD
jgi:Fur family zinc uptake transcriptional regulator